MHEVREKVIGVGAAFAYLLFTVASLPYAMFLDFRRERKEQEEVKAKLRSHR